MKASEAIEAVIPSDTMQYIILAGTKKQLDEECRTKVKWDKEFGNAPDDALIVRVIFVYPSGQVVWGDMSPEEGSDFSAQMNQAVAAISGNREVH